MRGLMPCGKCLAIALLFSSSAVVPVAAHPKASHPLSRRGPEDDPLPPELQPVPRDDHLPQGDSDQAIREFDSDYQSSGYEYTDDYDPEQGPIDYDPPKALPKRTLPSPRDAKTWVLRSITVGGKSYIKAFDDNAAAKKQKFVFLMGSRKKSKKLKAVEDTRPMGALVRHPGYQRDHVHDLGIWTRIATGDKPAEVSDDAWKTVRKAILGVSANDPNQPKWQNPVDGSYKIGRILNDPATLRGIAPTENLLKSVFQTYVFSGRAGFGTWKSWERSTVWMLHRYRLKTKDQFDDTASKVITALKALVTNDDKSANAIEKAFTDTNKAFYDKGTNELVRVLTDAPVKNKPSKYFKEDDCANVASDPDDPTDPASKNILTESANDTPVPGPQTAPYAPGTCTVKVKQTRIDTSDSKGEYRVEPQILDANGASIAYTSPEPASAQYPLKLQSKLEDLMIITPENNHDYINFLVGTQGWNSNVKDGHGCTSTDWGKDDGQVGGTPLDTNDHPGKARDVTCTFGCTWAGGKSSDGSN